MSTASTKVEFLNEFPIFDCLSLEEKTDLAATMEKKTIKRYNFVYLPEASSNEIYLLAKGAVKIGTHSNDGREVIKALIHPIAMFGELGIVGETHRTDFAQALKEEVHLYVMQVSEFKKMMKRNFELSSQVMMLFGSRLMKAETKLESLIFKDARTRIVDFIKDAINVRGRRVGYEMLLKHSLTHQDIANITCTSRQTVTLVLNELRKSDLIHFNRGRILVRDMARLV